MKRVLFLVVLSAPYSLQAIKKATTSAANGEHCLDSLDGERTSAPKKNTRKKPFQGSLWLSEIRYEEKPIILTGSGTVLINEVVEGYTYQFKRFSAMHGSRKPEDIDQGTELSHIWNFYEGVKEGYNRPAASEAHRMLPNLRAYGENLQRHRFRFAEVVDSTVIRPKVLSASTFTPTNRSKGVVGTMKAYRLDTSNEPGAFPSATLFQSKEQKNYADSFVEFIAQHKNAVEISSLSVLDKALDSEQRPLATKLLSQWLNSYLKELPSDSVVFATTVSQHQMDYLRLNWNFKQWDKSPRPEDSPTLLHTTAGELRKVLRERIRAL